MMGEEWGMIDRVVGERVEVYGGYIVRFWDRRDEIEILRDEMWKLG